MIINPIGIDKPIQDMQTLLSQGLWPDIPVDNRAFYHRVFRNFRNGLLVPEVYVGDGEYQEVLFDDYISVLSWFDVSDETESYDGGQVVQSVGVFFAVNLDDLYPSLSHRAVEEAHNDVRKILGSRPTTYDITGLTTGAAAYGDFDSAAVKFPNMQPWHIFRFNTNISFLMTCKQ
jgi:hypothetical protein